MSATRRLPSLLLVHGAWHRKETWDDLITHLRKHVPELDIHTVQNPSSAPVPPEKLGGLYDDARAIREAAEQIGGPVVVCAHSYGGAPATQGLAGVENVRRVVYISGFAPNVGESLTSLFPNGEVPPFWGKDHLDEGYYEILAPGHVFYSDLDQDAAQRATDALGPHSRLSLEEPLTQVSWRGIPSTYIIDTEDNAVPVPVQEIFAARCQRVHRIAASHSPFLSRPAETAALLITELVDASATS
jgi:pimeloyl-ACP methyl ester carboxylesterase